MNGRIPHLYLARLAAAAATLGAVGSASDCTLYQLQKIVASDADTGDTFGRVVAIDGFTVVVGAPTASGPVGSFQGAAYVYQYNGSTWVQQQILIASDGHAIDAFGSSVAIKGDTIVIGAPGVDRPTAQNVGAVYVFTYNGTSWAQQQRLTGSGSVAFDGLGTSVAFDGSSIAAGAPNTGIAPPGGNPCSAYVFVKSGSSWVEQRKLANFFGGFGASVAVQANTLAVGAPSGSQGSAYVFVRSGTVWTQQQQLSASDAANFAGSLALDGNTVLAGANTTITPNGLTGAAYVFVRSGTTWSQQQKLTASDGANLDDFGVSVALQGDKAIVGSDNDSFQQGSWQGSAYVFARSGSSWSESQKLTALDAADSDGFGHSVAMDHGKVAIGAPFDDAPPGNTQGSVYIFGGCVGDINSDGTVDVVDFNLLLASWGTCLPPCPADLDGDGDVDTVDFNLLLANWGGCP